MIEENRDILDKPEEEDKERNYWKLGIFYYNRQDKRMFVPKRYGRGQTMNFGNPASVILCILLVGAIFALKFYYKAKGY